MPIYEYQCEACGHQLEALQKISDPLLTTCPECGQDALRKRISAAAFRLKGGGWYETDFKDKQSRRNVAGGDDGSSSGGSKDSGKDSGKTETKTESKSSSTDSGSSKSASG